MSRWSFPRPLAPIDLLPVELLAYIFVLTTHTPPHCSASSTKSTKDTPLDLDSITTPLVLTSVDKRWRRIALSTSALWTSLCLTVENVDCSGVGGAGAGGTLDTTHLTTYLALSRKSPIDILIDARDPEWDFSENDVDTDFDDPDYTPYIHPFTHTHMNTTLDLLLPHVHRWRSLAILTDTWSPMYAALARLSYGLNSGAPLLESLSLMRCNQFASYPSEFQPSHMKDPAFLPFGGAVSMMMGTTSHPLLPRLRNLNLTGVHLDWSALPHLLSSSSLRSLELSYHSQEVRPSADQFCEILHACPGLQSLVLNASGPLIPDDDDDDDNNNNNNNNNNPSDIFNPISLPNLTELCLGYTSALDGCKTLSLLDAPNVEVLTLEDATHPANPQDENAGCLLRYLATGVPDAENAGVGADEDHPEAEEDVEKDNTLSPSMAVDGDDTSTNTVVSNGRPPPAPLTHEHPTSTPVFPYLRDVTLTRVKACPGPFKVFYGALWCLERLELGHTSVHAASGLLPRPWEQGQEQGQGQGQELQLQQHGGGKGGGGAGARYPCPCPKLNTLCARGAHVDLDFIIGGLVRGRAEAAAMAMAAGAGTGAECGVLCAIKDVEVYVGGDEGMCAEMRCGVDVDVVKVQGTAVKVFRPAVAAMWDESSHDETELEYHGDDGGADPFADGGAFNDPAFDEYYESRRHLAFCL